MPSCNLPLSVTSLNVRNTLRAPAAYIENLYVGKQPLNPRDAQTLDVYIENRLRNLTNLETAIDAKVQSMQQAFAAELNNIQQKSSSSGSLNAMMQTIQQLEQRIQQLEYRPVALQGPEGKQGIPGPQGPPGKTGPRGLRGPSGGGSSNGNGSAKKLSELIDIDLKKLKNGDLLSYSEEQESWVPVSLDDLLEEEPRDTTQEEE